IKAASRLTKEEWKEYFAGHWYFGGARQVGHEAMFPEELPRRLIRMFTFQGDTVLDPFVGSGTTVKAALDLSRNAVGYEINGDFLEAIQQKLRIKECLPFHEIQIMTTDKKIEELPQIDYTPAIRGAVPRPETHRRQLTSNQLHKVTDVTDAHTLRLDNGARVTFLGVRIDKEAETLDYLHARIMGKNIFIKDAEVIGDQVMAGYVYLKNRIFVNAYLIKSGLGSPDLTVQHRLREKFITLKMQADRVKGHQGLGPTDNSSGGKSDSVLVRSSR
ncbi:MAG: site-specific DNA-methyltransferase, partial [Desulfobaccales bacterium]